MAYTWKNGILKGIPIGENTTAGTALATLVAQDSNMTEAFFYTLSGSDSSLFNIDVYGRLSLKQAIDYDTTGGWWRTADGQWHNPDHRYSVVVNAFNDTGVLQTATTFILTVMDVNEAPVFQWQQQPLWGQNSKGAWNIWASGNDSIFLNISENNVAGMQVAKFRALDPEMGSNVTYDITGADKGYFSIDTNGRLYLKSSLNFEDTGHAAHNYSVVVVAGAVNGGAAGTVSDLVVISLGNVDDNPTVWKAPPVSGLAINQKAGIDSISALASPLSIANFAASDGDAGQWVSYYLSGHDSWLFSINSNGVLMRKYDFDYEKIGAVRPNHQIWVMVSAYAPPGGGVKTWGGHISQLFILTINDLANTSISGIALNENNAIGNSVGQFAILAGGNTAVTYSLGGTDANYFTVDATGNLKLKSILDFEDTGHAAHNYSVVVTANPIDGSVATSQLFVLSLGNADDNATVWKKTPLSGRAIDENGDVAVSTVLATGVSIAQFDASDGDGQAIGYSLSGGDAALFSIDGNGVLYRKVDFDYETIRASHQFTVMVNAFGKPTADGITVNGVSISQLFVLTITNVAEAAGFVAAPTGGVGVSEINAVGFVVGNFLATDSAAAAMTYSLGGADANYFTIDANGNLKLKSVLDFENTGHTAQNYTVMVTAGSVVGSHFASQVFVLTLGNVDEATGFVATTTGAAVSENNTVGFVVGNFLATDGDKSAVTYSLGGTDANYFTIDANGNLKLKSSLDYEDTNHTAKNYSVVVTAKATDTSPAISQLFILTLGDVAEAAGFVAAPTGGVGVSEINAVGFVVGNFLATDSAAAAMTYSLGGADANYFTIDANGNLKLKSVLDFENTGHTAQNYTVVVTAGSVVGSHFASQVFVLSLGNVDEATSFVATTTGATVNENNAIGLVVGNFLATDGDKATVTYSLGGTDANYFTIDATGNLKLKSSLDFEDTNHTAKNYSVVVTAKATDTSPAISQLFILTLGDVAEAAGFVAAPTGGVISENNVVGIVVGNFLATDGDGAAVTYDLSGADANYFTIDATGKLKLTSVLDFEDTGHTAKNYSVVVTAKSTDASGAISQVFVLSLGNSDEITRFVTAPTGGAISENNTVGFVVGNFLATDSAAAAMTYGLGGTDANYFTIDANGNLKLKSVLDFENTGHTAQNYTVMVTAGSVVGSHFASQVFVLSLGNVDEATGFVAAPTGGADISENNAVGVVVGNFLATDGDGSAVTYSLGGTDANYFTIDATGNLKLKSSLDFEDTNHTAKNYSVVVTAKATDASPAISQLFVLSLGDVVEAAGFVAAPTGGVGVSEINAVGFVVGNFLATDSAAAAMTYGLGGADANYFTIDANGNLKLKSVLDFENTGHTAQNYTVVVTAGSVVGSHFASQVFVLSLGNVDEATSFVATTTGSAMSENNAVGIVVGNFLATDSDGSAVTYSLGGTDANYFTIDANGNLKLTSVLDFENTGHTAQNYTVMVTAGSVVGSHFASQVFVLSLGNVDEATSFVATTTGAAVNENNAIGLVVGNFLATDSDGSAVTYSLGGTDANYFTIDANGNLKLKSSLDFEDTNHTAKNYSVVVTAKATDASPAISQLFVLSLGDVAEAAGFVAAPTGGVGVSENNTVGVVVGNFLATDSAAAAMTYSLGGADANYFTIDANGNLKLTSVLDFENTGHTAHNYTVMVTAGSVVGSHFASQVFVLTLGNVDEATSFVATTTGSAMSENNTVGLVVGNFLATDGDKSAVTYSLGGTDANYFTIDATGNLKLKSSLDFEDTNHTAKNYSVVVTAKATDTSPAISQLFILTLGDVAEAAGFVAAPTGGVGVNENNTVGVVVGNFLATDSAAAAMTYGLGGADANYFTIDANGNLKLKSVLDFENTGHTAQNYTVVVTAGSVVGSHFASQVFVLTLGNVDEATSFVATTTGSAMSENNTVGLVVGNFLATDSDGSAVTYSLGGTDANYFTIDATGDLKLKSVLDFENTGHTAKNYSVVVTAKATDASPAISQLFILTLGDVAEAAGFVAAPTGGVGVSEINAVGFVVGNFLATDSAAAAMTYSLGGADANYFTIDANGNLKLKSVLDFENTGHTAQNYTVVVTAGSVVGSHFASQVFVLSLGNVDEATSFVATTTGATVNENNAIGLVVGNFLATDGDKATVTYSLGGTDANYFTIDATGNLKLKSSLDFEDTNHTAKNYSVVVRAKATDASPAISQLFILTLGNVGEATSFVATTTGGDISENNTVGVVVGNFLATDGPAAALSYDLSGTDADYFTIDANGNLKLISVLDYEDLGHPAHNYTVVVRAVTLNPAGFAHVSKLFVLSLGDTVEATGFVAAPTGSTIYENNAVGVAVASFLATEATGAMVTYSLGGTDSAYFTIDATGNLKLTSSLDFEDVVHHRVDGLKRYSVVVAAKPTNGSGGISQLFILTLYDVFEPIVKFNTEPKTGIALNENNAIDVSVGDFWAWPATVFGAIDYILGGTDANYFSIDGAGQLRLKSVLDYEYAGHNAKNYSVVVTARSVELNNIETSRLFVLSLGNVDEATRFVATTTGVAVSENNTLGVVVGNFLAIDSDGSAVTYDLSGTDANYFTIDATGNLKLKSSLDYEDVGHIAKNYSVMVTAKATDTSPAISQLFVLSLGDVAEATNFVATTTGVAVNENNAVGVVVGNFLATDGDGAAVTYDLSGTDANYFTIDATGNLKLKSVLDFEDTGHPAQNYTVLVTAKSSDASGAVSQLFVLSLGDIDDPTSFIATTTGSAMSENNTVGVVVANFLATDGDGAAVTYDLSGTDANYFTIDATGKLKLTSSLDFEDANHTAKNYSVLVTAKSTDASPAITQLFILTLGNADDPTGFVATTTGSAMSENNTVGIAVGNFLATDGDGATVTYSLGGTDANYFTIDATGNLKLKSVLDFENAGHTAQNYTVLVMAKSTDASGAVSQLFVLSLGDVDDPTGFVATTTGSAMSENNTVGVVVANFLATDGDGASVTYDLSGADANYFTIDATGKLKLTSILDYEDANHTAKNYSVLVTAKSTDASPAISQLFVLTLGNVGEATSFVATTTGADISENNTVGVVVANFLATDGDRATVTYSLGGTDANYFTIDANGDIKLKSVLDFENTGHAAKNYSVVVTAKATDASPAISQLFILTLGNADDPTGFIATTTGSAISENNTVGIVMGNFRATDGDGAMVTYDLSGTDANYFTIDATGNLKLKSILDYEDAWHTAPNYSVVVMAKATDTSPAVSQLFILTLGNVAEPMRFVSTTTSRAMSENNAVNVVVGNFLATEVTVAVVTYSLGGTDANYFTIDANGDLKLKSVLDFEDVAHPAHNYTVMITAKSDQGDIVSRLFVLSLGNVVEGMSFVAAKTGGVISENNTLGVAVANFMATEATGAMVTYSLGGTDSAYFTINSNGNLKLKSILDYEDVWHPAPNYSVVVTAKPTNGGDAMSQLFILSLGNVAESMNFVAAPTSGGVISENNAVNVVVGNFFATDVIGGAIYSLGGTDANYFTIVYNGNLKIKSILDFEDPLHPAKNYSVVITATSPNGTATISQLYVLTLGDVAEPMAFVAAPTSGGVISENNAVDVVVGNFLVTEVTAATVTYSLGGTDANYFTIAANGELKLKSVLDFEDAAHPALNYSVVVTAKSDQGALISRLFILSLGNVVESTWFTTAPATSVISENNAVGVAVANFMATEVTGAMVTYSLGGTDADYFTINANGNLKLKSILDYEDVWHSKNYSVVVMGGATNGNGVVSQLFILSLGDVVEVMQFGNATTGSTINENNAVDATVLGALAWRGPSLSQGAADEYVLTGADAKYFTIGTNAGLRLKSILDYEDPLHPDHLYSVVITAMWNTNNTPISRLFVLTLGNVAEPMNFVAAPTSGGAISENNAANVVVGNFLATDVNQVKVTYSLGGTDADYFTIDATGSLKLKSVLDFEDVRHAAPNYSVVVTAKSDQGDMVSRLFIFSLGNVVEPMKFVAAPATSAISENNAVDVVVGNFMATEATGAMVTYSLGGVDADYFTIAANGNIKLKSILDYEDIWHATPKDTWPYGIYNPNYSVVVTASATNGSGAISQLFVLNLGNIGYPGYGANSDPEAFNWDRRSTGSAISENNAVDVVVGTRADQNSQQEFFAYVGSSYLVGQYALSGADAKYFTISSSSDFHGTGSSVLRLKSILDYEDALHPSHLYSVVITATYPGNSGSISRLYVLTLGNVNESMNFVAAPTSGGAISENNAAGVSIANFMATDSNKLKVNYSLGGGDATYFTIDANGNLKLKWSLDSEDLWRATPIPGNDWTFDWSPPDGAYKTNYSVVITARSDQGESISQLFVLTLGNIAEPVNFTAAPPTYIAMSENNALGVVVGNFLTTEASGAMVTYSLSGNDAAYFTIDAAGKLKLTAILDYEDMSREGPEWDFGFGAFTVGDHFYDVMVTAKSTNGSGAISQNFVIKLGDVTTGFGERETWKDKSKRGIEVSENNAVGLLVLDASASNPDGFTTKYTLSGADAKYFSIDNGGQLKLKSILDFEDPNHPSKNYSVLITFAAWSGIWGYNPTISRSFVLTLGNVAEMNFVATPTGGGAISENNAVGVSIANFLATDVYKLKVNYSLGGADSTYFTIDATGNLKLTSILDYEDARHTAKNYSLVITATSDLGEATSQSFVLSLGNVAESTGFTAAPPPSGAINENNAVGVVVGNFLTTEASGATVTYSLSGSDSAYFTIDVAGHLKLASVLDYEDVWRATPDPVGGWFGTYNPNYSVVVTARATNGSGAISQLFVLNLGNVAEKTYFLDNWNRGAMIPENKPVGYGLFNPIAFPEESVFYYSLSGPDWKYFKIEEDAIWGKQLQFASVLDYEDPNHPSHLYSVVITAVSTFDSSGKPDGVSRLFVLTLTDVVGASHADHTAYIDGTTATHAVNVGGIIGHDDAGNIDYANVQFHGVNYTDKVITRNVEPDGLQLTTVNYVVRGISDLESLRLSFNGFTDTDGSKRNHWFFVQDDATDHSGHIVFDADGQNVNLHALNNGGGLATADQINLLAGSNYGIDGDFAKPADLNLNLASDPLHQNTAGALTFDQFLALLGGNNHISFV